MTSNVQNNCLKRIQFLVNPARDSFSFFHDLSQEEEHVSRFIPIFVLVKSPVFLLSYKSIRTQSKSIKKNIKNRIKMSIKNQYIYTSEPNQNPKTNLINRIKKINQKPIVHIQ
jgi:hypothetical protein